MKRKIKRGQSYYLVLHKRDWIHRPAVIVLVKAVRVEYLDWVIVEQTIEGVTNKITVNIDWLAPNDIARAKDLLHNMKMWEKRWSANSWRHHLNQKTAKTEVTRALGELPKYQQREIMKQFKQVYPDLLKPDNTFKVSKMKMTHWDALAWATIASKYPLKKVWDV